MTAQKINLRIDRIITDQPGLDHTVLVDAIREELAKAIAAGGPTALGQGRNMAQTDGQVRTGDTSRAGRIAQATVNALQSGGAGG